MSLQLDAPLTPAVDGFINPENDEAEHIKHLNTVLLQLHRNVKFERLVADLGPYLTNSSDRTRQRATLLLAEILSRLPELPLSSTSLKHFSEFFCARLGDYPSVGPSLSSLK